MYPKLLFALLLSLMSVGVHASETMVVKGQIKSRLSQDVKLTYQNWDVGTFTEDELVINPGGHVAFNFFKNAYAGKIAFMLAGGEGKDSVACLYEVTYGSHTYVRGAMTLTGPYARNETKSLGMKAATCWMNTHDWDYGNSMSMRFIIK